MATEMCRFVEISTDSDYLARLSSDDSIAPVDSDLFST